MEGDFGLRLLMLLPKHTPDQELATPDPVAGPLLVKPGPKHREETPLCLQASLTAPAPPPDQA